MRVSKYGVSFVSFVIGQ